MTIYLAGSLFSSMERRWNRELAALLEAQIPDAKVILPQDFKYHRRFTAKQFFHSVYRACVEGIETSDLVVAMLDGPDADSGTAWECGYAVAKGKPVIGIRTDFRPSQEAGMNLMLSRSCTRLVIRPAWDESVEGVARDVARAARKILSQRK